ncbi:hypothetical protein K1719_043514 [Acacia pycnantha]|nr:hypothetical protein K1719_043514 [Acacia pycnantha]
MPDSAPTTLSLTPSTPSSVPILVPSPNGSLPSLIILLIPLLPAFPISSTIPSITFLSWDFLSFLYSWISKLLLHRQLLDSASRVPLTRRQCFLLISAGSFSHFFLDHLFEENGHSTVYTWILSTGWWESRAPINPDAVVAISFLCTCLYGGFFYINRPCRENSSNSFVKKSHQSLLLILFIACLYCLWCAIQIYMINPRRPAVGEEADLGVVVFLATFFFLPHELVQSRISCLILTLHSSMPSLHHRGNCS